MLLGKTIIYNSTQRDRESISINKQAAGQVIKENEDRTYNLNVFLNDGSAVTIEKKKEGILEGQFQLTV